MSDIRKAGCFQATLMFAVLTTTALGGESWGKNLLKNADFKDGEKLPTGWIVRIGAQQPGEAVFSTTQLDNAVVHNAGRSLRLEGDSKTTRWYAVESPPIPVSPGRRYRFSGWLETEDVRCENGQFTNCNLYTMFADARNNVVKVGRNQVAATEQLVGTNSWRFLETIVPAPQGAVTARVGIVLTCSGKAWFDDVSFQAYGDLHWKEQKSDRFHFRYDGDDAPTELEIRGLEEHLNYIEKTLAIKFPGRVGYYKYPTRERKAELTGKSVAAHYETDGVHAINYQDRHEMVHVVALKIGGSMPFFVEGLAVHLTKSWNGRDLDSVVREFANEGKLVSIQQLMERGTFGKEPMETVYPQAGSFVRYLINQYGVAKFKRFYPLDSAYEGYWDQLSRFKHTFGKSLEEIEDDWLNHIQP